MSSLDGSVNPIESGIETRMPSRLAPISGPSLSEIALWLRCEPAQTLLSRLDRRRRGPNCANFQEMAEIARISVTPTLARQCRATVVQHRQSS